jgi:hypothetical protein
MFDTYARFCVPFFFTLLLCLGIGHAVAFPVIAAGFAAIVAFWLGVSVRAT